MKKQVVNPAVDIVGWLRANCPEPPCIVPHRQGQNLIGLELGKDTFTVLIPDSADPIEELIAPGRLWFCDVTNTVEEFLS